MLRITSRFALVIVLVAGLPLAAPALACPFCTVESQTLTEEIALSDAVVIARLIEPAPSTDAPDEQGEFGVVDPDTGKARFRIERILVGEELLEGVEEIEAVFFGEPDEYDQYFLRGVGTDVIDWNIPLGLTDAAVEYIDQLQSLPESGPKRLSHFLQYLQHEDPLLAQDTYDEFARAPYEDVIAIADQIDRERLWQWIESRDVSPSRRSLFFTLLGVCGGEEDQQRLRKMMLTDGRVLRSAAEATAAASMGLGGAVTLPVVPEMVAMEARRQQLGFNALVGCYLKLAGAEGLDVVDQHFLADPDADPTKVYGALIAIRFLGEETDEVPMDRLLQSVRLVLDKPDFAEQAITDLARWEDWSVLDRLVTMFKEAEPKTYIKEPIVAYLDQASRQPGDVGERASEALAEIEKLDPQTVKRARSLLAFGFLGRARGDDATPEAEVAAAEADAATAADTLAGIEPPQPTADTPTTEPEPGDASPDVATTADRAEPPATDQPPVGDSQPETETVTQTEPPTSEAGEAPAEPPSRLVVLGLPILIGAGLMALVWIVLRGGA